ncbi:sensor histidine kinase, partial [Streptosporangium algeriense]
HDAGAADDRLAPLTAEALHLVSDETRKLTRLVEDLIEVSRFDAGAAVLNLDEVDLGELITKTLALRHWQDQVRTEVPAGLRARLDPRRVDVILANLVGNALRHGGPTVSVLVQARIEADRIAVTVSDDGPGIPADLLPHVFDRFTKGDAARTPYRELRAPPPEVHVPCPELRAPPPEVRAPCPDFRVPYRERSPAASAAALSRPIGSA